MIEFTPHPPDLEAWCDACGKRRRFTELLRVANLQTKTNRLICRPSISERCFGSVGPRLFEVITLAAEEGDTA